MIKEEAHEVLRANPTVVDIEKHWKSFISIPDFALRLWNSERNAYGALYYAYEDFLVRCVGVVNTKPDYRMPRRSEFANDIAAVYGDQIRDICWLDKPVAVSREIRHAIVHNGGRITKVLANLAPDLPLEHDQIVILAPDTTELFNSLKRRAYQLVKAALLQS
jgi:hypothetical protein